MVWLIYAIVYAGAILFILGCVRRILQYSRAPIHLRWELYPVPHEDPARVAHGGSYFEEPDWWQHPRRFNLGGELGFMVPEMLFLKGLREFNRKLWRRSFPFHFGLYLMIGSSVVLGATALASLWHPVWLAGGIGLASHGFYKYAGLAGSILALVGSVSLLIRRLTDDDLKNYTAPADVFNLLFFSLTLGLMLVGYSTGSAGFRGVLAMTRGLLSFHAVASVPPVLATGVVLLAALTAYVPYTHMAHFIAKYFTYHSVRWDDSPKRPGRKLERKMAEYLTYRPTWSAPHIGADGRKTWADVAQASPFPEKSK
jgi:nitrate reductase gamma subunit